MMERILYNYTCRKFDKRLHEANFASISKKEERWYWIVRATIFHIRCARKFKYNDKPIGLSCTPSEMRNILLESKENWHVKPSRMTEKLIQKALNELKKLERALGGDKKNIDFWLY